MKQLAMHGPQRVGGQYHNGYWHYDYTVIAIDGQNITIRKNDGVVVTHCTSWDYQKDRVSAEFCRRLSCH